MTDLTRKIRYSPGTVSELFVFPCGNLNLLLVLVTDSHANFASIKIRRNANGNKAKKMCMS